MRVGHNGDLVAVLTGTCAGDCKMCLAVCPFSQGVHDSRTVNHELFGTDLEGGASLPVTADGNPLFFHEHAGWFLRSVVGHSQTHRSKGASGGLVTMCLEHLLTTNQIDQAAVVGMVRAENGVAFRFESVATAEALRDKAGSVYCPVEISHLIRGMVAHPDIRWAVVGVPCLCTALRKAMKQLPALRQSVKYVLGLACGMYQNLMYTEVLIVSSGLDPADVEGVRYRVKRAEGAASNYGFMATTRDGKSGRLIPYCGLPLFLGANAYFRCNACNFCKDVFAESADACFMDAWLPEYSSDPRGTSLVLIRDASFGRLFTKFAGDTDGAAIDDIATERLVSSQAGHVRRKRVLIDMRLGAKESRSSWADRLEWWLQKRTQKRSKAAWERYGRRYGLGVFWVAIGDLLIIQKACAMVRKFVSSLLRLIAPRRKATQCE